ncbi:universal stress protein [Pseudonocardia parietis]|uniref:Nucleotide-binding universal stress UspA family protein n=1 Tax=Pseudonocardia parietis TaxID=570936 RepID=A0ABS4VWI5_9PSEU|nr:universal stress protein [Pseudonocardia parietis]MBP2368156.1 nucleotide-binding universal stress UspA family protein [Pseudonocardia parietis]
MSTSSYVILVVLLWLLLGLGSVLLFLGRRGYRSASWYLLGAVLGPLFVPIAVERGRRVNRVHERSAPPDGPRNAGQMTVLVGIDGSVESDQAVRDTVRLFGPAHARVVLVAVADPDIAEFGDAARRQERHELLATRASWLPANGPAPVLEVLYGQPDLVLLEAAANEQADVLVIGRRGRGLSHVLLGSVARSLTRRSPIPVLLSGQPTPPPAGGAADENRAVIGGHGGS